VVRQEPVELRPRPAQPFERVEQLSVGHALLVPTRSSLPASSGSSGLQTLETLGSSSEE
jgi:hypothetical protein